MKFFIILFLIGSNVLLYGQQISGTVFDKNSETPIEFVNIGIVGKNIGTVSDQNGNYTLQISPEYHNDTLLFSYIGYHSYYVGVSDFINLNSRNAYLEPKKIELAEVIIRPRPYRVEERTLGVTTRNIRLEGCLRDSINGMELGLLIKNDNRIFLKEINLNVSECTYDSVFYRINIYKARSDLQFENILTNTVYVNFSRKEVNDKIIIDLRQIYIELIGDFLVTFEAVKYLGNGFLCFSACLDHETYVRRASQGTWETAPLGMSISVLVDVEIKEN